MVGKRKWGKKVDEEGGRRRGEENERRKKKERIDLHFFFLDSLWIPKFPLPRNEKKQDHVVGAQILLSICNASQHPPPPSLSLSLSLSIPRADLTKLQDFREGWGKKGEGDKGTRGLPGSPLLLLLTLRLLFPLCCLWDGERSRAVLPANTVCNLPPKNSHKSGKPKYCLACRKESTFTYCLSWQICNATNLACLAALMQGWGGGGGGEDCAAEDATTASTLIAIYGGGHSSSSSPSSPKRSQQQQQQQQEGGRDRQLLFVVQ